MGNEAARWAAIREQMLLDPQVTYLNTGSYGIVPRVVFERVSELRRQQQLNPVDFIWRRSGDLLWDARCQLARFINADPRQLIFTVNVTTAINIVAASLRLAAPGEILLTNHEYGAVKYAWERAAQLQSLSLRSISILTMINEPEQIADALIAAMSPAARVFFFSHILYTTGMVLPVKALCAEARRRGILTVIDAAHAPGMLPIDVQDIGCDFYAANLHKWLLAPVGAGFLYVAPGLEDRLQPLTASWGWHYNRSGADERDEFGGTPRLRSFEFEGSRDITPWLVVPEAIDFHERIGPADIRRRQRALSDHTRAQVNGRGGVTLATPDHEGLRGGITAFRLPPCDPLALRKELWERHGIEINIIDHPDGHLLRVSTHFYNTMEEIDRLAAALSEAARGFAGDHACP